MYANHKAQTLIVTAGCGWVQRDGGHIEEVHPGDVVWFKVSAAGILSSH